MNLIPQKDCLVIFLGCFGVINVLPKMYNQVNLAKLQKFLLNNYNSI